MLLPLLGTFAVLSAAPSSVPLSDQAGVYGIIDRVEFEPSAEKAERVRVYGAFAVAEGRNGNYYRSPKWGFLAFHLDPKEVDKCRTQWRDLASVAGKKQCVGFGFRYRQRGVKVWRKSAKDVKSVLFETGMGIRRARNAKYTPLRALECLPRPLLPTIEQPVVAKGGRRPERRVELSVQNCISREDGLRYVFEIERPGGDVWASEPIAPGEAQTKWSTRIALLPGETVRWRCRVLAPGLRRAAVAQSEFRTVAAAPVQKVGR